MMMQNIIIFRLLLSFFYILLILQVNANNKDIELNIFIDQWYMQRGIASDESRLSKPPFNPPKDLEWVQQEGKDVWVLQLNEEAEALEQAKEEQEKQVVIEEMKRKPRKKPKKKD